MRRFSPRAISPAVPLAIPLAVPLVIALALVLAGCEGVLPAPDWQQMIRQHKFLPFSACDFLPDGRAMQPPPEGTAPRDRLVGRSALTAGVERGAYATRIPIPVDRALLETGHASFETFCAACHGALGDGESEVAKNMDLRQPPSLLSAKVRAWPPGRVFQIATSGYGLMPSYENELSLRERWAVVAYLGALQLSQSARLADLPEDLRARAEAALARESP
jgi:mono/diheme cytochrome c family protein